MKKIFLIVCFGVLVYFFEVGNYTYTDFALDKILNGLILFGIPWASAISFALCLLDLIPASLGYNRNTKYDLHNPWLFRFWVILVIANAGLIYWAAITATNHNPSTVSMLGSTTTLIYFIGRIGLFSGIYFLIGELNKPMFRRKQHDQETTLMYYQ